GEGLVAGRTVDEARDQLAFAFERDRNGKQRNPVQEIGGAVEGVYDEAVGRVRALYFAAFLHEEAVTGSGAGKLVENNLLGAMIGGSDEIGGGVDPESGV